MKQNFLKYIFLAIVIILIGLAIFFVYRDRQNEQNNTSTVEEVAEEPTVLTELRFSVVGYDTMNPILSTNRNIQDYSRLVFDSLLTLDENYHLQPCLATEWSRTGDTSYILKLRNDVKWHDGSSFTANDVKFTIDRLKETASIYAYNVQHVIQVDIIDDYTIKLTIDTPIPFFEYNLTFPILSNNFYLEQDFQTTEKNTLPMGTGMYKVYQNDATSIVLKKNQNYWDIQNRNAKVETITITKYSSMGEVYNEFKLGNIDLLTTQTLNLEDYIGTIGFNKKEYKGRQQDYLAFNCTNNVLSHAEVRQAISYAIDKNSMIANVYNGKYETCNFPLDFGIWCYDSDTNSSGYNPDQAKQVLVDAGWTYRNNIWYKTENYRTLRLSFNLVVNNDNANRVAVAEIIKENLENVGIKVNIIKASNNQYQNYLTNKNYDMILTGNYVPLSPDLTTYFGSNNLSNYQNDEATSILNELSSVADESVFKEKIKRLYEIYKNDVPSISLYLNRNTVVYSQNLIGDVTPNCYNIFYHIENWYRQY